MEAIMFVELLGRHGEVLERHVIDKLPARLGRSYQSDVILDDVHVAAEHVEIRLSAEGGLEIADLGSVNGTYHKRDKTRLTERSLSDDDTYRIGQTIFRIRLPDHQFPQETRIPKESLARSGLAFLVTMLICSSISYVDVFAKTFSTTDSWKQISSPAMFTIMLLGWAGIWALVSRINHGRANFFAHGNVIFLGVSSMMLVEVVKDYVDFMFDIEVPFVLWVLCATVVIVMIISAHLHLTMRMKRFTRILVSVIVASIISAVFYGLPEIKDEGKSGMQSYNIAIKPTIFLISKGIAPAQFVDEASQLKMKVNGL